MTEGLAAATAGHSVTRDGITVALRPAAPADADFLRSLYAQRVADELGLPPEQAGPLFDLQHRAREQSFTGTDDYVVTAAGEPVGRLVVRRSEAAVLVVEVEVLRERRGAGIGGALLAGLVEEARTSGVPLRLYVMPHNPARRLYERHGLVVTGASGAHVLMEWNATC